MHLVSLKVTFMTQVLQDLTVQSLESLLIVKVALLKMFQPGNSLYLGG